MSNIPNETTPPTDIGQQRSPTTTGDETMERLFQALFYRISVLHVRIIPKPIRRLEEAAILVMVFG